MTEEFCWWCLEPGGSGGKAWSKTIFFGTESEAEEKLNSLRYKGSNRHGMKERIRDDHPLVLLEIDILTHKNLKKKGESNV